jgi:Bacteriocin-protection, YdeI or OmpD-Associated/Domain of unknown function (DUF1905)
MDYTTMYHFIGTLERFSSSLSYKGIFIPAEIMEQLPGNTGRLRVKGTINGIAFNLAIQSAKEAGKYFMVGNALKRATRIKEGQHNIEVYFQLADPNELEIPEELLSVLEQDEEAKQVFNGYTIGYQRSLVHYIAAVINIDSRIKRALEIAEKIKNRTYKLHQSK